MNWIMTEMESVQYTVKPPALIAVPLGTGNDLARAVGCGGNASSVRKVMAILKVSYGDSSSSVRHNNMAYHAHGQGTHAASPDTIVGLDRWHLSLKPAQGSSQEFIFCNYFSVGFDARVIARFDAARKRHKYLYRFQTVNYLWY